MRRIRLLPTAGALIGAATVLFLVAMPATAEGGGPGARFHIEVSYASAVFFGPPCATIGVTGDGRARGTHVGTAAWSNSDCLDFASDPGLIDVTGTATVTAANGDTLGLSYFVQTPSPPGSCGVLHHTGTFTIMGGTGRFEGATGSGTVTGDGDTCALTQDGVFDGTIRFG